MVKISIIMPLYNTEKYLSKALESIQKQTFQEYEVICINDASTDNTTNILRQFQNIDSRIRIISNSGHSGAAVSRNRGIIEAKGKYISFLDGDDIFDETMLELSYQKIEKHNADIVMFEGIHVLSEYIHEKRMVHRGNKFIEKYCREPFSIQKLEPIEFMNWTCAPWNKLYRKSFLDSNQLRFQSLTCANDMYFVYMALMLSSKLIMLEDRRVMVYVRDHDVPTRISYDRDPMCTYQAMIRLGEELLRRGLFDKLFQHYYCALFYNLRSAIILTKKEENAKQFYEFLKKEGIDTFAKQSGGYYQQADEKIYELLEKFKSLDFTSGWYKQEEILNFCLRKNGEKVISVFRTYMAHNKRVAVWGAGRNGIILLSFLQRYNIRGIVVIDCDEGKQGMEINGYKIKRPEECLQEIQVIIASSAAIYSELIKMLENTDIEIIDIGEVAGRY